MQHELIGVMRLRSVDPNFTATSLSTRLANAGILPMFGFPSPSASLPRAAVQPRLAPEDIIDRELDIAISQFAPEAKP